MSEDENKMKNEAIDEKKHRAGFVNIIGKPNVGKSTLMNVLVGEKLAIITPKAQTTRHRIVGIVNGADFQIVYSDTPGIIEPHYKLQESMMGFVRSSFADADVFIILCEFRDRNLDIFKDKVEKSSAPKIFVLNKMDRGTQEEVQEEMDFWKENIKADEYITISALHNAGVSDLLQLILKFIPIHPPYYDKDELTDRPERFFVSEIIREKIFLNYKQEIPYSVEVVIDSFKEEERMYRIRAIILCNRKTQKPILIGKGGSKLKKVGTEARIDIEKFMDKQVYLELFVKIREGWRENDQSLRNFGYKE